MDERFRGAQDRFQAGGEGEDFLEKWAKAAGAYGSGADAILILMVGAGSGPIHAVFPMCMFVDLLGSTRYVSSLGRRLFLPVSPNNS